jgi:hypothetical protein
MDEAGVNHADKVVSQLTLRKVKEPTANGLRNVVRMFLSWGP